MTERRYLDVAEFRELGFLQEANRLFFHPHGLALEVRRVEADWTDEEIAKSPWMQERMTEVAAALVDVLPHEPSDREWPPYDEAARAVCRVLWPKGSQHISGVWDCRDDPEGVVFGDGDTRENALRVLRERARHREARAALFGRGGGVGEGPPDIEPLDFVYEGPEGG